MAIPAHIINIAIHPVTDMTCLYAISPISAALIVPKAVHVAYATLRFIFSRIFEKSIYDITYATITMIVGFKNVNALVASRKPVPICSKSIEITSSMYAVLADINYSFPTESHIFSS